MTRRKWIGVLFFLFGGTLLYFFLTGTPWPKPIGVWLIAALFLGMAVCGLVIALEKPKTDQP
jgi:hypothetical protein